MQDTLPADVLATPKLWPLLLLSPATMPTKNRRRKIHAKGCLCPMPGCMTQGKRRDDPRLVAE